MTINELISTLSTIRHQYGNVDVTFAENNQFCDVIGAEVVTSKNCPDNLRWCQSEPVVLLSLDHS